MKLQVLRREINYLAGVRGFYQNIEVKGLWSRITRQCISRRIMVSVSLQAQLMRKYNSWVSWRGRRRDEVMVKHQCSGGTGTSLG